MDFSSFNTVGLFYQHAYASRFSLADTLIVKISVDCGASWTRLYSATLDDLETAPEDEESFVPQTADDWCGSGYGVNCNFIDLTAYAQEKSVKIAFETFGRFGNNIYIDNVEISNSVGLNNHILQDQEILIYPNPSEAIFNIMLPIRKQTLQMSVRTVSGQLMHMESIEASNSMSSFDASALPKGVYVISFVSNEINVNRKIIVR